MSKNRKLEVRTFNTGATRDGETGKLDYEGFESPLVMERYAEYLNFHRIQSNGELRDSDRWQRGIPRKVYMKSLLRHLVDLWKIHRGYTARDRKTGAVVDVEDALCAVLFNAKGYLFELLNAKMKRVK